MTYRNGPSGQRGIGMTTKDDHRKADDHMTHWAIIFLGVALIAAVFGFGLIATATVAQSLAVIFLMLSAGVYAVGQRNR